MCKNSNKFQESMPALLFRRFVLREKSAPPTGCLIPALEITLFQGFRKKQNSRQENSRWGGRKQRFDKLWVWTSSTQVLHCCFVYIVAMVASPAYRWLWAIKRIQRLVLKRQRLSEVCCQGYKNHNALINCPTLTSITLKSPFFFCLLTTPETIIIVRWGASMIRLHTANANCEA